MKTTLRIGLIMAGLAASNAALGSPNYADSSVPLLDLGYSLEGVTIADLKAMEGKRVLGRNRELIGHIGKVDEEARLVDLKTPEGATVPISTELLVREGDTAAAPTLSRGDLALIDAAGELFDPR